MTQEEKAKKYDEVVCKLRRFMEQGIDPLITRADVQDFFPELRESEDERVRKALITYFQGFPYNGIENAGTNPKEAIAWLKKQGNQKSKKVSIWKHWKDGICGNGEGKLIYLIKNGDAYSLSSSLGFECDYIDLSELDNLMLEKQGEQKPTDEDMKEALRTEYEKGRADAFAQMQKEWSEEDEVKINRIVACLENLNVADNDILLKDVDWLKSLKERYIWKPSNAQIRALEYIIDNAHNTSYSCKIAKELLEQLKKLKGE